MESPRIIEISVYNRITPCLQCVISCFTYDGLFYISILFIIMYDFVCKIILFQLFLVLTHYEMTFLILVYFCFSVCLSVCPLSFSFSAGIKLKALHMLGKWSTTEVHLQHANVSKCLF